MAVLKSARLLSLLYVLASAPTATLSKPLLLESVLGPIVDTIGTIASGAGLIEGTLGAVKGVLGVDQTFDYVVVGGGTAGNAMGVRLAEAGFSVAIIEAGLFYELGKPVLGTTPTGAFFGVGTNPLDTFPTVDWGFITEPQAGANGRRIHYAQGKCLGGTSALNFMVHHRASTGAYDAWADAVGDDSYRLAEWLPHFKNSITFTGPNNEARRSNVTTTWDPSAFAAPGAGGPVQVTYTNYVSSFATWLTIAFESLGLRKTDGFNNGNLMGFHYAQATIRNRDQTRSSSASYVHSAVGAGSSSPPRRTLKVFTQTQAKQVLFDADNKATGVKVSLLGALPTYTIKARKEVIVSGGAFKSPQLLMVSGVGPRAQLEPLGIPVVKDLPGVGQNMWDHIMFGPSYAINMPTLDSTVGDPLILADALLDYTLNARGPLTSNVADVLAWEKIPEKYRATWSAATRQAFADNFPADWPEVEHISANGWIGDFGWPAVERPRDGKQYATDLGAMVAPLSRGNVTISSRDTSVPPRINPNWLTHPADKELAVSWYRRIREVWDTPALRTIRTDGDKEGFPGREFATDAQILNKIRDSLVTVWHPSCTNKMGKADDPMAVVDSRARVYGVKGLRVVDASAFPVLPPGHPQSTIYALAEKIAADIIRG
ncbi:choline dehydrogenase [Microdochium nivale]|nr:choline dehydrogenase [Microdochium nivale]